MFTEPGGGENDGQLSSEPSEVFRGGQQRFQ